MKDIANIEVEAPSYYDIRAEGALSKEAVEALVAFVEAMFSLGRFVIIKYSEEENKLYFTTAPETLEATP